MPIPLYMAAKMEDCCESDVGRGELLRVHVDDWHEVDAWRTASSPSVARDCYPTVTAVTQAFCQWLGWQPLCCLSCLEPNSFALTFGLLTHQQEPFGLHCPYWSCTWPSGSFPAASTAAPVSTAV